ncbi:DEAD/DEAH box helicase [Streptomyces roseoverticillatus]|uniref:DEAD/DEAH box helicase n=1 Tax=Streptomyces roseoverticillatus TaxID=66429 RepID=UPI003410684C
MNRMRVSDRSARTHSGNPDFARGGNRSSFPRRAAGRGRRRTSPQGEFALPKTVTSALPAVGAFADLDMPAQLLGALGHEGMSVPFPIQAATLASSLAGRDVLGRGRTGSGKTLAFGLALPARTAGRRAEPRQPPAFVLVPTREPAQQVTDAYSPYAHSPYARSVRLRLTIVDGDMPIGEQAGALRTGAEVVVATPDRLKDLIDRGDCRLDQVAVTVADEAGRMTGMRFVPQGTELLDQVRPGGQRISATLDRKVDLLVRRYVTDPVVHSVAPSAGAVTTMEHHVLHVPGADKHRTTTEIAARDARVIMFLDTKRAVSRLTEHLLKNGVRAVSLHGGKSQPQRTLTLFRFKSGHVTVLVATNVAARGIHVDNLDMVVSIDPPCDHKDYLRRGGRTVRAGDPGSVVTLVTPNQRRDSSRMTAVAGITAQTTQVRSGEAELSRITGARAPSGVPVIITAPTAECPRRIARPLSARSRSPGSVASGTVVPGTAMRSVAPGSSWPGNAPVPQEASFDTGPGSATPHTLQSLHTPPRPRPGPWACPDRGSVTT